MSTPPMPGRAVDVPVPPELAQALGYRGAGRYVGFYHLECVRDLRLADGRASGDASTAAFQAYRGHPAVAPLLRRARLGSFERDAAEMLLLDRELGRVTVAPLAEARGFLEGQWPPKPPRTEAELEAGERRAVLKALGLPRRAETEEEAGEQRGRVGRMLGWLDQCPVPRGRGR